MTATLPTLPIATGRQALYTIARMARRHTRD